MQIVFHTVIHIRFHQHDIYLRVFLHFPHAGYFCGAGLTANTELGCQSSEIIFCTICCNILVFKSEHWGDW